MKSESREVIELIKSRLTDNSATASMLLFGRGGCYPNYEQINVNLFPPAIQIVVYKENFLATAQELATQLTTCYREFDLEAIVLQCRYLPKAKSNVIAGELPSDMVCIEDDLRYHIDLQTNQNCGLFLDMATGREWIGKNAPNSNVLNLFSYTCALSVVAIANGAEKVTNVDMSSSVLTRGRENHRLNNLDMSRVNFFKYNILKSWSRVAKPGPYDLIIIDPPTFQSGSFNAERDYIKVLRRTSKMLKADGKIFAALNSPHVTWSEFKQVIETVETLQVVEQLEQPATFPQLNPDNGLKILILAQKV